MCQGASPKYRMKWQLAVLSDVFSGAMSTTHHHHLLEVPVGMVWWPLAAVDLLAACRH